jgi:hypothetical protein
MRGNGNREFENGEMQLWLRNKSMIQENKGVPVLHVRKKAFCKYYKMCNPLSPELNPVCYLLALLEHHFLHVSGIGVKSLTLRLLMSYI